MYGRDNIRVSFQKMLKWNEYHTKNSPFKYDASLYHRMSQMPSNFPPTMIQETKDTIHLCDSIVDGVIWK